MKSLGKYGVLAALAGVAPAGTPSQSGGRRGLRIAHGTPTMAGREIHPVVVTVERALSRGGVLDCRASPVEAVYGVPPVRSGRPPIWQPTQILSNRRCRSFLRPALHGRRTSVAGMPCRSNPITVDPDRWRLLQGRGGGGRDRFRFGGIQAGRARPGGSYVPRNLGRQASRQAGMYVCTE